MLSSTDVNVLVCGHIDIIQEQFDTFYVPDIEALLIEAKGYGRSVTFYVGGASGTDDYAQKYLANKGYTLVVCDKGEQNNVKYATEDLKIEHKNGFESYPARDQYMVQQCRGICLILRNIPKSLGSGSFHSLISMDPSLGKDLADKFQQHARAQDYETIEQCIESFGEYTTQLKEYASKVLTME
jgi:hypothetical protein